MSAYRTRAAALIPLLMGLALAPVARAEVLRQNVPAQSLTAARIAALPDAERAAWAAYLDRSQAQALLDRATLAAELPAGSIVPPPPIALGGGLRFIPLAPRQVWDLVVGIVDHLVSGG